MTIFNKKCENSTRNEKLKKISIFFSFGTFFNFSSIERIFLRASAIYGPKRRLNICPQVITTTYYHFSHIANTLVFAKYRGPSPEALTCNGGAETQREFFFCWIFNLFSARHWSAIYRFSPLSKSRLGCNAGRPHRRSHWMGGILMQWDRFD